MSTCTSHGIFYPSIKSCVVPQLFWQHEGGLLECRLCCGHLRMGCFCSWWVTCPCSAHIFCSISRITGKSEVEMEGHSVLFNPNSSCYRRGNWNPNRERIHTMSLVSNLGIESKSSKSRTTELFKIPGYIQDIEILEMFIFRVCVVIFLNPPPQNALGSGKVDSDIILVNGWFYSK